jgi:hypothetical protein
MAWTHIADPDEAERLLPSWLGRHYIAMHGRFGLLLATGDVMRITSISAVHHSSDGVMLLDVLLDSAGVPEGADLAWRSKHFLGAPVPGAPMATVNLAHVVAAVDFVAAVTVSGDDDDDTPTADEAVMEMQRRASEVRSPVAVEGDVLVERSDAGNLTLTTAVDRHLKKKKSGRSEQYLANPLLPCAASGHGLGAPVFSNGWFVTDRPDRKELHCGSCARDCVALRLLRTAVDTGLRPISAPQTADTLAMWP